MNIKELKELIDATIYPNGEKKIKASSHQSMLHEIVDYTDENITTINSDLEGVKSTLEAQGNNVEQLKESSKQAELNDAKVNQKIDNLASNIVGLGGDIKGSVKGADVIELPSIAINGVSPKYIISGNTSIDGVQSVQTPLRVKSIGANLFDYRNCNTLPYYLGGGSVSTSFFKESADSLSLYIKSPSDGTINIIKGKNVEGGIFRTATTDKDITSGAKQYDGMLSIDLNSNNLHKRHIVKKGDYVIVQFSYSRFSKDTPDLYIGFQDKQEIYVSSTSYINSETTLKSALQAKDYAENGNLFKNIFTTKEFKKDDVISQYINESLVNTYDFYFDIEENVWLKDGFSDNTNRIAIFSDGETYSCVGSTIETDVEDIIFFIESGINYIMLKINKSKIDELSGATPLDKFKSYIGNRSLIINYQANTEQIKLDTSGVVTTKSNGTIFIENIKNVTDFYTANGLDVKDFKELVSIYKYEGSDSVQLDPSKAVFTTTLKHPDLTDGDLVFFEYKYLDSPLWGDNEIEYFNKNNVLQSENGKLWQKVEKASNEGILTTELKEIV